MVKKVFLDPGHGGRDPGAVDGKSGDSIYTEEKDLNLAVAKHADEALKRCGFLTSASRTGDTFPTLQERYHKANAWKADIFVSFHFNAGPSSARGMEVLYKRLSLRGRMLANDIFKFITPLTPWSDRKARPDTRGLAVLNGTNMPAVIIEFEFITNNISEKLVSSSTWQHLAGEAVAKGVCKYFGVNYVPVKDIPVPVKPPVTPPKPPSKPKPPATPAKPKPCHNPAKMPTLKQGAKGNYVKHLQRDLNKHGAKLSVDGDFGPATTSVVKKFQNKYKMVADGVVGPKTWTRLV